MRIEDTKFGTITIDGKTLSGDVIKRKKKLSKKYYGTSHMLSKDEAKFVFEKMQAVNSWVGANGQCAVIARSRSLFCEKGLRGFIAADPGGDPALQQVKCKEDRPFPRNLLRPNSGQRRMPWLFSPDCDNVAGSIHRWRPRPER